MNTKTVVKYKITGRAKNENDPKHFLVLGMRGRPQVEIKEKGQFLITGKIQDDVFENVQDLQILKRSLQNAINHCNCTQINIEVSLHIN